MSPEVSQKLKNNSKPAFGLFPSWHPHIDSLNECLITMRLVFGSIYSCNSQVCLNFEWQKNKTATETNTHRSSHLMKKPGCLKEDNPFLPFKGNHRNDSGDDLQPHRGGCLLLSQFLCRKKQLLEESGVWFETRIGGWKKKPVAFFGKSVLWNSPVAVSSRCASIVLFKGVRSHLIQTITFLPIATMHVPFLIWYNMHVEIC